MKQEGLFIQIGRREGAGAAAALLLSLLLPRSSQLPKLCVFNQATGIPCPFCGLTRSFIEIGHGDLKVASRHHLLSIPAYLTAVVTAVSGIGTGGLRVALTPRRLLFAASALLLAWGYKLVAVPRKEW